MLGMIMSCVGPVLRRLHGTPRVRERAGRVLIALVGRVQETLDLVIEAFTTESRRLPAKTTKDDGQRPPDWPVVV